jgi:hypothetical protein
MAWTFRYETTGHDHPGGLEVLPPATAATNTPASSSTAKREWRIARWHSQGERPALPTAVPFVPKPALADEGLEGSQTGVKSIGRVEPDSMAMGQGIIVN